MFSDDWAYWRCYINTYDWAYGRYFKNHWSYCILYRSCCWDWWAPGLRWLTSAWPPTPRYVRLILLYIRFADLYEPFPRRLYITFASWSGPGSDKNIIRFRKKNLFMLLQKKKMLRQRVVTWENQEKKYSYVTLRVCSIVVWLIRVLGRIRSYNLSRSAVFWSPQVI